MAHLRELQLEHYRGFYERQTITFAIPKNVSGSGLTVLVGPNNSGKSTVADGLRLVGIDPQQIDMEHRHVNELMQIIAVDTDGKTKILSNPDRGAVTAFHDPAGAFPQRGQVRVVPSRRAWSSHTGAIRAEEAAYWNYAMQQIRRDEADTQLVARLVDISTRGQRAQYDSILKMLLPQISNWRIELSRGQRFVQYLTATGATHSADLLGDGMASLFRIALAIHDSLPGEILVVDEPELSLHPQAQKRLASELARVSSDRQVVLTTHSPYFVNWSDIEQGAVVCRLTQERDGVKARTVQTMTLQALGNAFTDWQKPSLLDTVAKEIFFADETVFFEGQEDVGLLRKFAADNGLEPLEAFGYGAGGAGSIKHFLQMAADLGIAACAIYDGDKEQDSAEAHQLFPNAMIEKIPTPDIRDKPERDINNRESERIAKEGLFDRHGTLKDEHKAYLLDLVTRIRAHFRKR